jgi:hypothetical protein
VASSKPIIVCYVLCLTLLLGAQIALTVLIYQQSISLPGSAGEEAAQFWTEIQQKSGVPFWVWLLIAAGIQVVALMLACILVGSQRRYQKRYEIPLRELEQRNQSGRIGGPAQTAGKEYTEYVLTEERLPIEPPQYGGYEQYPETDGYGHPMDPNDAAYGQPMDPNIAYGQPMDPNNAAYEQPTYGDNYGAQHAYNSQQRTSPQYDYDDEFYENVQAVNQFNESMRQDSYATVEADYIAMDAPPRFSPPRSLDEGPNGMSYVDKQSLAMDVSMDYALPPPLSQSFESKPSADMYPLKTVDRQASAPASRQPSRKVPLMDEFGIEYQ